MKGVNLLVQDTLSGEQDGTEKHFILVMKSKGNVSEFNLMAFI